MHEDEGLQRIFAFRLQVCVVDLLAADSEKWHLVCRMVRLRIQKGSILSSMGAGGYGGTLPIGSDSSDVSAESAPPREQDTSAGSHFTLVHGKFGAESSGAIDCTAMLNFVEADLGDDPMSKIDRNILH